MLFLVHHGDAVGPEEDPTRPLSDAGRAAVDRLARDAAARGAKPGVIRHSGKLRARQTAEIFWRHCNPLAAFSAARGLQPGDPTSWIVDAMPVEPEDLMLVGHFPHLPRLLAHLLADRIDVPPADFPLHGMVALENSEGKWVEKWRLGLGGSRGSA